MQVDQKGEDRRRHARIAVESIPAALLVAGHDLGLHIIVDASESGVFVRHPAPVVPAGTPVALALPSSTGRPPLMIEGRIVRVVPQGSERPGYGVEWNAPSAALFDRIVELHTARAGPAARPTPPKRPPLFLLEHPLARLGEPPPVPAELRALVIDHDRAHAQELARALDDIGLPAAHETRAKGAVELFEAKRRHVVLVLVDFLLPDLSGVELIRRLRKDKPSLAIVATTDVLKTVQSQRPLLMAGANRVLSKPISAEALGLAVRELLPAAP